MSEKVRDKNEKLPFHFGEVVKSIESGVLKVVVNTLDDPKYFFPSTILDEGINEQLGLAGTAETENYIPTGESWDYERIEKAVLRFYGFERFDDQESLVQTIRQGLQRSQAEDSNRS